MTSNDLLDQIWDDQRRLDRAAAPSSAARGQSAQEGIDGDNAAFLEAYRSVLRQAERVVQSRQDRGEHDTIPLSGVFVHGVQDITFLLLMKARRLIALEGAPQHNAVELQEELRDIISYAAFGHVLIGRQGG